MNLDSRSALSWCCPPSQSSSTPFKQVIDILDWDVGGFEVCIFVLLSSVGQMAVFLLSNYTMWTEN